jgi:glycosyltransferase involved in cell wall biosynthesis
MGRSVYLTRFGTEAVLRERNLEPAVNEALSKKRKILNSLQKPVRILSVVRERDGFLRFHPRYEDGDVTHLPCFSGAGADVLNNISLALNLMQLKDEFDSVLIYNFYTIWVIPVLLLKLFTCKKVFVDLEDDYRTREGFLGTKIATSILSPFVDGAIVCNEKMTAMFGAGQRTVVINSFADLSYLESTSISEPLQLLYAGSLDEIRGADLVGDLSASLRETGIDFQINVTGKGSFASTLRDLSSGDPHVNYLGFVSEERLRTLLDICDAGLVLQKPDHPFSKGSFPSKIDLYAQHELPVICLEEA